VSKEGLNERIKKILLMKMEKKEYLIQHKRTVHAMAIFIESTAFCGWGLFNCDGG